MHARHMFARLSLLLALPLALAACVVERDPDPEAEVVRIPAQDPVVRIETETTERRPLIDVDIDTERGPFERVGARLDQGARKLDEHLERGAGKLGEAMQEAGRDLQEKSERAQQRRVPQERRIDVDINVER